MYSIKLAFVNFLCFILFFWIGNVFSEIQSIQSDTVIRQTQYGPVLGTVTELAQKFLGVPFAAPAKRFVHVHIYNYSILNQFAFLSKMRELFMPIKNPFMLIRVFLKRDRRFVFSLHIIYVTKSSNQNLIFTN